MATPARQNLYRKYRPQRFADLAGQEHISKTIQSAVASDRVNHAYMFSGPRGTGKTSSARLLAKILNCTNLQKDSNGLPDCCGVCDNCRRIEEMNFMDIVEIDAASNNGVEDIRQMRETVKYRPAEGKYKIYIIDEVHMLSGSAFNAFLKTLEEPPENVIFVLATTDPQKVPATIISRCQCFDFHSVSRRTIQKRLQEIVDIEHKSGNFPDFEPEALSLIAECAEGGFRDALSLLDQISSSTSDDKITLDQVLKMTRRLSYSSLKQICVAVYEKQPAVVIKQINDLFVSGYEPMTIARDLLEYFRRCMILKIDPSANQVLDLPQEQVDEMLKQVVPLTHKYLISTVSRVERILGVLRSSFQAKIMLESELIRLAMGDEIYTAEAMEKRVEALEQKVAVLKRLGGIPAISGNIPVVMPVSTNNDSLGEHNNRGSVANVSAPRGNNQFEEFRSLVNQKNSICGAFLTSARFKKPENGILTIKIEQSFAFDKLKEAKNLNILNEAAKEVFSDVSSVNIEFLGKTNSAGNINVTAANSNGRNTMPKINYEEQIKKIDEGIKQKVLSKPAFADALNIFGGEVVDIFK